MKRWLLLFTCLCSFSCMHAGVVFEDGKVFNSKYAPEGPAKEHYEKGLENFKKEAWSEAIRDFRTLTMYFENTSYGREAAFYAGVCLYHMGDMDLANDYLSSYLSALESAEHYEEAFSYKFAIANAFSQGAKKHLFGIEQLPKVFSSKDSAYEIYDEIVFSFPASELAAQSYFAKAELFYAEKDYNQAIETYQQLIGKFPSHEKSAKAFLALANIYHKQLSKQTLDPDLLDHARVNLKRFKNLFPGDPLVAKVADVVEQMEGEYAESLYDTGRLYERKKLPKASVVYYYNVVRNFPSTEAAKAASRRLGKLKQYAEELNVQVDA